MYRRICSAFVAMIALAIVATPAIAQVQVTNSVTKQDWGVYTWSADGCTPFVSGDVTALLSDHYRQSPDGSTVAKELANISGVMYTADKQAYRYRQIDHSVQVQASDFTFIGSNVARFMVVIQGPGPKEFADMVLGLEWDGTTFTVTFAYVSNCRAAN